MIKLTKEELRTLLIDYFLKGKNDYPDSMALLDIKKLVVALNGK